MPSRRPVTRNLSLRVSEETYAKLAAMTPASETVSGVARRVLERELGTGGELPSLVPAGATLVPQSIDFGEVTAAIAELRSGLEERLEILLLVERQHGEFVAELLDMKRLQAARDRAGKWKWGVQP